MWPCAERTPISAPCQSRDAEKACSTALQVRANCPTCRLASTRRMVPRVTSREMLGVEIGHVACALYEAADHGRARAAVSSRGFHGPRVRTVSTPRRPWSSLVCEECVTSAPRGLVPRGSCPHARALTAHIVSLIAPAGQRARRESQPVPYLSKYTFGTASNMFIIWPHARAASASSVHRGHDRYPT